MSTASGIIISTPVTYVNHLNGRTPKTLNSHTSTITPIPMKLKRFRWTTPSYTSQFVVENHCA